LPGKGCNMTIKEIRGIRGKFTVGLAALLQADEVLNGGRHRDTILATFAAHGIVRAGMRSSGLEVAHRGSELWAQSL